MKSANSEMSFHIDFVMALRIVRMEKMKMEQSLNVLKRIRERLKDAAAELFSAVLGGSNFVSSTRIRHL
jgi:hypothetical protein